MALFTRNAADEAAGGRRDRVSIRVLAEPLLNDTLDLAAHRAVLALAEALERRGVSLVEGDAQVGLHAFSVRGRQGAGKAYLECFSISRSKLLLNRGPPRFGSVAW